MTRRLSVSIRYIGNAIASRHLLRFVDFSKSGFRQICRELLEHALLFGIATEPPRIDDQDAGSTHT